MISRKARNRWLDILRAAAIVLVVNCHIASYLATENGASPVYSLFGLGGHGVDLFFVLSGWLLGHVLFREYDKTQSINLMRFYRRRWLRTLPAYYAMLGFTYFQAYAQGRFEANQLTYLVFMQKYLLSESPFFGVSWSLCVEEHFYLLIAPLALWIGNSRPRAAGMFLFVLVIPAICRALGLYENIHQSHVRLDQCAAGVAMAYAHLRLLKAWEKIEQNLWLLVAAAMGCAVWAILSRTGLASDPPLVVFTFMSCVAIAFADRSDWYKQQVFLPGAYYIATRSYSMYLTHVEAIAITKRLGLESSTLQIIFIWSFTCLIAELLYRWVELPFMKIRDANSGLVALART